MLFASTSRYPSTEVLDVFSDPAKSTRQSFPSFLESSLRFFCPTVMMMIVCDLEDTAFIFVEETARF